MKKFENLKMKKLYCFLLLLLTATATFAQQTTDTIEKADTLRSSGKIYVVVSVLLTIFSGIIIYLIFIDKKVSKLEKKVENK